MTGENRRASMLWTAISDELDIPKSLYERAIERHRAVGKWLTRPESKLKDFGPRVSPQGSFRLGTVIRPIDPEAEYDLDHVVVLNGLTTSRISQLELKRLHGAELAAYSSSHRMTAPTEHNRCWRIRYRDELPFHLDSLPSIPAGVETENELRGAGVAPEFAERAILITDRRHVAYSQLTAAWLSSNPRGFARWFASRAATGRDQHFLAKVRAGLVEDVPSYEWKSPLQRSVQILKRHRDVMFIDKPEFAPISMVITNLAAHAYRGERSVAEALLGIVERMESYVNRTSPRVPNPSHPREDYADKWKNDARWEQHFRLWCQQVRVDVERLSSEQTRVSPSIIDRSFRLTLKSEVLASLAAGTLAAAKVAPAVVVNGAPKPWGT